MTERRRAPRARRGETFIEVLIALLIVVLSTLLLVVMVGASGSIDIAARQQDEKFYEALSEVESMQADRQEKTGSYFVTITPSDGSTATEAQVDIYTKDSFTAYRAHEDP